MKDTEHEFDVLEGADDEEIKRISADCPASPEEKDRMFEISRKKYAEKTLPSNEAAADEVSGVETYKKPKIQIFASLAAVLVLMAGVFMLYKYADFGNKSVNMDTDTAVSESTTNDEPASEQPTSDKFTYNPFNNIGRGAIRMTSTAIAPAVFTPDEEAHVALAKAIEQGTWEFLTFPKDEYSLDGESTILFVYNNGSPYRLEFGFNKHVLYDDGSNRKIYTCNDEVFEAVQAAMDTYSDPSQLIYPDSELDPKLIFSTWGIEPPPVTTTTCTTTAYTTRTTQPIVTTPTDMPFSDPTNAEMLMTNKEVFPMLFEPSEDVRRAVAEAFKKSKWYKCDRLSGMNDSSGFLYVRNGDERYFFEVDDTNKVYFRTKDDISDYYVDEELADTLRSAFESCDRNGNELFCYSGDISCNVDIWDNERIPIPEQQSNAPCGDFSSGIVCYSDTGIYPCVYVATDSQTKMLSAMFNSGEWEEVEKPSGEPLGQTNMIFVNNNGNRCSFEFLGFGIIKYTDESSVRYYRTHSRASMIYEIYLCIDYNRDRIVSTHYDYTKNIAFTAAFDVIWDGVKEGMEENKDKWSNKNGHFSS